MRIRVPLASISFVIALAGPVAADPITLDPTSTIMINTHDAVKAWLHGSSDTWYWFSSAEDLNVNPVCPCPVGSYVTSFMDLRTWGWGGAHIGNRVYDGVRLYARFYTPGADVRVEDIGPAMQPSQFSTFKGTLTGYRDATPLFTAELQGAGNFSFDRAPEMDNTGYPVSRAVYEFNGTSGVPTPEPVSLLLFGAGLGAAAIRKIRSSRQSI